MKAESIDEPISVSLHTPALLRWSLSAFGLLLVVLAGHDLLRVLWPLSVLTPVFVLLMGTGVAAGLGLIVASQFGADEQWRIDTGRLVVTKSLRTLRRNAVYTAGDVATIGIEVIDWDSRPNSYRLSIGLRTGKMLKSPDFSRREDAEAARDRLLANRP